MWWFLPIISATQEADIEKIAFQGQPGQKVSETPISINKPGWRSMPVIQSTQETLKQEDCSP
jgi:hypothetical protein